MAKTQKNKYKPRIRQRASRRVVGSRMYKNYSEDMLKLACEAISSYQVSSRDAEKHFGIPRRTILNKLKKLHSNPVGHPTNLTNEEEKRIVKVLQASSDFGAPLTKLDLKLLVHEYLKKNSRDFVFKNRIPGDAWVQGFLARHSHDLSIRATQNISKSRAEKGPQEITKYFENLYVTLKDIPATNIVNFDETNLADDPGSAKCIFRRGVRYPERISNSSKGNISIMFTAIASGQCLPLYVVYKATNLYSEWITGGPSGARYNCTKSGWFDSAMFEDYFENIIIPWACETHGTKVVICDNLSSHLSVKVVELCEQDNIKFVFIPPRSSHLTQPLDVAFFGPLKKVWRRILYQYKLKNPKQTSLNKKHFPKLLVELTEVIKLNENKNIKSGFRASGIFPVNPQEVLKKMPEMQEKILSYGLDQTLIDYLKEIRSPNPMAVKRNKKLNCEPGKSVTVTDLNNINLKTNILNNSSKKKNKLLGQQPNKREKERQKPENNSPKIVRQNINKEIALHLDDQTGKFIIIKNHHNTLLLNSPKSLVKYCITAINFLLNGDDKPKHIRMRDNNDKCPIYTGEQELIAETSRSFTKKTNSKVAILSNIIIKDAPKLSDVVYLKDINKTDNMPFIAKCNNELPKCLQEQVNTRRKRSDSKCKRKVLAKDTKNNQRKKTEAENKKKIRKNCAEKRKKRLSFCESSSTSADSNIKLHDTDDSVCETMDGYLSECLKELEEQENIEPIEVPFGLSDIEYFVDDQYELKEGDWIIAQFATKKSLKHFVGNILSITNKKPRIKFV